MPDPQEAGGQATSDRYHQAEPNALCQNCGKSMTEHGRLAECWPVADLSDQAETATNDTAPEDGAFQEGYDLGYQEAIMADLGLCAYRIGVGTCSFGCYDEPACVTSEPREGWPSHQALAPLMEQLGHKITPGVPAQSTRTEDSRG